ncbi:MAG: hypothetical protein K6G62_02255 [Eubacterium sp.]|nr:hypothetical protein [Eubacterium sp.]
MKKTYRILGLVLALTLVLLGANVPNTASYLRAATKKKVTSKKTKTKKAATYKSFVMENAKVKKSGKYYLKNMDPEDTMEIGVCESKDGYFVATDLPTHFFANGTYAYYLGEDLKLYRYSFSSGTSKVMKTISTEDPYYEEWSLKYFYKGKFYLQKFDVDKERYEVYVYIIGSKKLKRVMKHCHLLDRNGSFVLGQKKEISSRATSPITLYRFSSKGLKKVKRLANHGGRGVKIGKFFYFTAYPSEVTKADGSKNRMSRVILYRVRKDGSGQKKKATYNSSSAEKRVYASTIRGTYCVFTISDGRVTSNYKCSYKKRS